MKKTLLVTASILMSVFGFSQLNGNYTVNAAQATGGTNYQTFTAAMSALVSNGVSGPVVFNCIQGTYNQQSNLSNANIAGTSTTNTITFQSASTNTNEVLWTYSSYPIYWYYCTFGNIKFDGIHFATTGTTNACIYLYFGTFTNATWTNCVIDGAVTASTSTTYAAFCSYYTTQNNLTVSNNEINNGSMGVLTYYSNYGYSASAAVTVENNEIHNYAYMGIYAYGYYSPFTSFNIKDNDIRNSATGYAYPYGIYCYYPKAGSQISGNMLVLDGSSGGYGLLVNYAQGNSTTPVMVTNNVIQYPDPNDPYNQYGLYCSYNMYTKFYHNTVDLANNYTSSFGAYLYYSSTTYAGNEFKNNIINSGQSSNRTIYTYWLSSAVMTFDNNVYSNDYGSNETNIYNVYTGQTYTSLASWQAASSQDANSQMGDPLFSSSSLVPQSASVNNSGTPVGVTTDITGASRSVTTPDPGAYEFSVPTNNAQITVLHNPSNPICDEDTSIVITLKNTGLVTLSTCSLHYKVNSTVTNIAFTGSLAVQADTMLVLNGNTSFNNGDDFSVWSSMPNGVVDSSAANDTISMTLYDGMAGTYAIPADFATFSAAASALSSIGICDDVVFNVSPGTYTEQVTFDEVPGASADATITFQSANGNTNSVILTASTSGTVKMLGADYVTFSKMRINNTAANVFQVAGASNNLTIDNCWLKGISISSTGGTYSLIDVSNATVTDFTLTNNKLEKGANWLNANTGSTTQYKTNFVINDNYMKDQSYGYGYLYYINGMEMNRNVIKNDSAFSSTYGYFGMGYWQYVNNFNITKNSLSAQAGQGWYYAIYMINCVGSNNPRSQISNNCINTGNANSTTGSYAWYMSGSGIADIYNNSFVRETTSSSYCMYISSGGSINMKNNNFYNKAASYALYVSGGFSVNESDYNNFYNGGGAITYFGSASYNTLQDHQNGAGQDMHSMVSDPSWIVASECVTCNDTIGGGGTPLASVTDDINGAARSLTTPDIGAVEYVTPGSFSLGGDDTLCGNSIIVEAGPAQSVSWGISINNGATQSFNTPSVTLNAQGGAPTKFDVSVIINTQYCGNGTDNAVIMLVPDATLDPSDHICADETATLMPGGGTTATYNWSNGGNTSAIVVDAAGTYSVNKMEMGCESGASIVITKSAAVSIPNLDVCEANIPLTVDATIIDGTSYAWNNGANITSAINNLSDAGNYSVTATDSYGCVSSSDFFLTVLDVPVASITETHTGTAYFFDANGSSYLSANTTYFWDFNYNGATGSSATESFVYPWADPSNLVTYNVTLVVNNGCGEDDATKTITPSPVGIEAITQGSITLYPNPTSDNVKFNLASPASVEGKVQVVDVAGRVLASQVIAVGQTAGNLDMNGLASGSYLIKVEIDGLSMINPIVKQ